MNNENKDIPGFEETHSRLESLSIIDPMTKEQIQDFINKDYSWTTLDDARFWADKFAKRSELNTEPDWTPTL